MKKITSLLVILSLIPTLSGCLALGIGAATALGGYMTGNFITKKRGRVDDNRQTARDYHILQQTKVSGDERLKSAINTQLLKTMMPQISLETTVQNGVVTILGTVPNPQIADKVIDVARRAKGVRKVLPRLNVVSLGRGPNKYNMPAPNVSLGRTPPYNPQNINTQAMQAANVRPISTSALPQIPAPYNAGPITYSTNYPNTTTYNTYPRNTPPQENTTYSPPISPYAQQPSAYGSPYGN